MRRLAGNHTVRRNGRSLGTGLAPTLAAADDSAAPRRLLTA
jgi:hypothetical protein